MRAITTPKKKLASRLESESQCVRNLAKTLDSDLNSEKKKKEQNLSSCVETFMGLFGEFMGAIGWSL